MVSLIQHSSHLLESKSAESRTQVNQPQQRNVEVNQRVIEILKQDQEVDNVYMEFSHQSINIPMFKQTDNDLQHEIMLQKEFFVGDGGKNLLYENGIKNYSNSKAQQNNWKEANNPGYMKEEIKQNDIYRVRENSQKDQQGNAPMGDLSKRMPNPIPQYNENKSKQAEFVNLLDEVPVSFQKNQVIPSQKQNIIDQNPVAKITNEQHIVVNPKQVSLIDNMFDQLFAPKKNNPNANKNQLPSTQSQENWFNFEGIDPPVQKQNAPKNDWEDVFNIQNLKTNIEKKPIQPQQIKKMKDDELDKLKTSDPSLSNKDITSTQLKKFIYHEVSKSNYFIHFLIFHRRCRLDY